MEYIPDVHATKARILSEDLPSDSMPARSGIYMLTNRINGYAYIGQSRDMLARTRRHVTDLAAGRHANPGLQADWRRYGAAVFRFHVLTECEPESLNEVEESLIAEVFGGDCYNATNCASGRPLIGDEPMRRVNVMLDQTTIEKASDIGSGNLSAGLRIAVAKHRKRKG